MRGHSLLIVCAPLLPFTPPQKNMVLSWVPDLQRCGHLARHAPAPACPSLSEFATPSAPPLENGQKRKTMPNELRGRPTFHASSLPVPFALCHPLPPCSPPACLAPCLFVPCLLRLILFCRLRRAFARWIVPCALQPLRPSLPNHPAVRCSSWPWLESGESGKPGVVLLDRELLS